MYRAQECKPFRLGEAPTSACMLKYVCTQGACQHTDAARLVWPAAMMPHVSWMATHQTQRGCLIAHMDSIAVFFFPVRS